MQHINSVFTLWLLRFVVLLVQVVLLFPASPDQRGIRLMLYCAASDTVAQVERKYNGSHHQRVRA